MNSHVFIPEDVFVKCIKQIKCLSDELHDGWLLHEKADIGNAAYISKKAYKTYQEVIFKHEEESGEQGGTVAVLLTFDYHVVYSTSYAVPMLCFNAWKADGSLISLEESWSRLNIPESERFTTLTQMDHPLLMRPYFTIHPCKTAEMIGTFSEISKNPVVSWLSAVAPVVSLDFSPAYAKLTL